ncbi:MAG: cupin domain-containing protein, partial [Fibrella sp.]|nr:cupin domain-containing protein [Armatimonadota bacterium]
MTPNAFAQSNADAPAYWTVDILWLVLATGSTTDGQYTLLEQLCPEGSGPPPHTHTQREMFYILDGEITFRVGEETITASAGSFVTVPPGVAHSFRVDTETARVLNSYTPAGFERIILETGRPAESRTLPPRGLPMAVDRETVQRISQEIGMGWVDEPDVLRTEK